MKKKAIKNLRIFTIIIFIILSIFLYISIKNIITKPLAHVKPSYEQISINKILDKQSISDDDYKTLFYQTGLGKVAIDKLLEDKTEGKEKILRFQENLFKDIIVNYEMITPITYQESIINEKGDYVFGTEIAPLENGYILVTRATYSLGWRHGHAAIVTDAKNKTTLEAAVLGQNSQTSTTGKWKFYPNFMILKLKDVPQDKLDEISNYACEKLSDIPYNLTVGIFSSKYKEKIDPTGTHCSHLVWYPFNKFGYDLDSDGGMIVTPMDIATSPLVEIVQVYGFDPKELWK